MAKDIERESSAYREKGKGILSWLGELERLIKVVSSRRGSYKENQEELEYLRTLSLPQSMCRRRVASCAFILNSRAPSRRSVLFEEVRRLTQDWMDFYSLVSPFTGHLS